MTRVLWDVDTQVDFMLPEGRHLAETPPLVGRALAFEASSMPEVGRLLHVLAAQRGRARVGEIGTGTGVGAAWIVSALPPEVPFVTVELDADRARGFVSGSSSS